MAKEKKGRKFGRHRDRSPSAKMYTVTKRWLTNQAKKAKRHARRMAQKEIDKIEYLIRHGKATLQAHAARLSDLRYIISQNRTGA